MPDQPAAPLHPSEQNRSKSLWFWLIIAGLLIALLAGALGYAVWSQTFVYEYKVTPRERKLLLNASQMIELLAAEQGRDIIVGVGPEDYYKQRLADGTVVIGYRYNHDEPDFQFTLLHEIRSFVTEDGAIAEFNRVAAESARTVGRNTEVEPYVFHAWEKATDETPAGAVFIQRSGKRVMVMQLSGEFSDDEGVLLFLAQPYRDALTAANDEDE